MMHPLPTTALPPSLARLHARRTGSLPFHHPPLIPCSAVQVLVHDLDERELQRHMIKEMFQAHMQNMEALVESHFIEARTLSALWSVLCHMFLEPCASAQRPEPRSILYPVRCLWEL